MVRKAFQVRRSKAAQVTVGRRQQWDQVVEVLSGSCELLSIRDFKSHFRQLHLCFHVIVTVSVGGILNAPQMNTSEVIVVLKGSFPPLDFALVHSYCCLDLRVAFQWLLQMASTVLLQLYIFMWHAVTLSRDLDSFLKQFDGILMFLYAGVRLFAIATVVTLVTGLPVLI